MGTKYSRYNYDPFPEPEQSVTKERRMAVATLESQAAYPPLTDVQRIARHYGISIREACEWLKYHTVEELLPERGTGAETGTRRPRLESPVESYPITLNPVSQIVLDGFEVKDIDVFAAEQGPLGVPPPDGLETRITDVKAGQKFDIYCTYWIKNTRIGWWRTCTTVYNETANLAVDADSFIRTQPVNIWIRGRDRIAAVVISEPTTFTVKLFANQEIGEVLPPARLWPAVILPF